MLLEILDEVELFTENEKENPELRLRNVVTHTRPLIVHGNGPSKLKLNALSSYLARAWLPNEGCRHCKWGHIDLQKKTAAEMPLVYLAVFIEQATPFLEEQLQKVYDLEYPKKRIHIFIHNGVSKNVFNYYFQICLVICICSVAIISVCFAIFFLGLFSFS